jgi:hypothetical protein
MAWSPSRDGTAPPQPAHHRERAGSVAPAAEGVQPEAVPERERPDDSLRLAALALSVDNS